MRWTRVAAAVVLGVAAGPLLRARPADAGDPPVDILERVRKGFKKIDLKSVDALVGDAEKQADGDLEEDLAELGRLHAFEMKKWTEVQRERWRFHALLQPEVRATYAFLTIASIGEERKEKIARLYEREHAELVARYGEATKPGDAKVNWERWQGTPEYRKFREEEAGIGTWYRRVIDDEVRKAKTGETKAGNLMDELEAECKREMGAIAKARLKVEKEMRRRKGEPEPTPTDGPIEDPEPGEYDPTREALRVAPIRTQYSGEAGVPVEFFFQVWHGARPYVCVGMSPRSMEGQYMTSMAEPGQGSFVLTFPKPGTFPVRLMVSDGQKWSKSISYSVTVTGKPVPVGDPEIDAAVKGAKGAGGDGGGGPGPAAGTGIAPFSGTFAARIWGAGADLGRYDRGTGSVRTGVPLTLTVGPDGSLKASVKYVLPKAEAGPPSIEDMKNLFWRSTFDLEGQVDWATGRTTISISNGHDERGYERDVAAHGDAQDSSRKTGVEHWREWTKADYACELQGWTLPGPQATAWLTSMGKDPRIAQMLAGGNLEDIMGLPRIVFDAKQGPSLPDRGFFGAGLFGGAPAPGDVVPKRETVRRYVHHTGYDGANEQDEDGTAKEQERVDGQAKKRVGQWYLKLLGAPPPPAATDAPGTPTSSLPAAEPKDGDLLAFGLWPVRPIHVRAGAPAKARAMGVFSKDTYDASDLSAKATWTSSPGLARRPDGTFVASAPGTYTITAETTAGGQKMTSTITVVVGP